MTNEMVLERKSNLVMPSHYVELDREEMAYVEGGISFWAKVGIIAACLAIGVAVFASLVTGGIAAYAVLVLKTTFAAYVATFSAATVASVIVATVGGGATLGMAIASILVS